jgi:hypothetical protein
MADKKREEFVVQDRRKFTSEGELRPESARTEEQGFSPAESSSAPAEPPKATKVAEMSTPPPQVTGEDGEGEGEIPEPPTPEEQHAQHQDYKAAGAKIDDMLSQRGAKLPADMEVSFEKLVVSLYMQAMMQMGMIRDENAPPRADLIGARHTIDMIALLVEKTKGNLTDREQNVMHNCLFELRMAFLEITNAITSAPPPQPMK